MCERGIGVSEEPTRAQQLMGDIAPKLVELTDDVLFGDIWKRPGLSPRDRSLITVAALVSLYRTDQVASHMRRALDNGVTADELVEAITHLAFYAGWPCAVTAIVTLRSIVEND
jgi:4-carboxymuconolactone decarboxylase